MKVKKAFGVINFTLTAINEKIECVTGNYTNFVYISTKNYLIAL